jgi:glucose-1-phosphate adenylyltransferase
MKEMVSIILGGGAGTRLFPLTATRSKPAVPIAGKYRLVDIPISNCLNSGVSRMFVLTMYNSASLNRHIKNTYHFSAFSNAFVDILAAEQTPDNFTWFQGTADAVRQGLRHVRPFQCEYVLILSGDQLYQLDFVPCCRSTSKRRRHHHRHHSRNRTRSVGIRDPENGRRLYHFLYGKAQVGPRELGQRYRRRNESRAGNTSPPWASIFSTGSCFSTCLKNEKADAGFRKGDHPRVDQQVQGRFLPIRRVLGRYREYPAFFDANLALTDDLPAFNLFDNSKAIYTRARMLPPAKISGTRLDKTIIAEGSIINASHIENAIIGIRSRIGTNHRDHRLLPDG